MVGILAGVMRTSLLLRLARFDGGGEISNSSSPSQSPSWDDLLTRRRSLFLFRFLFVLVDATTTAAAGDVFLSISAAAGGGAKSC